MSFRNTSPSPTNPQSARSKRERIVSASVMAASVAIWTCLIFAVAGFLGSVPVPATLLVSVAGASIGAYTILRGRTGVFYVGQLSFCVAFILWAAIDADSLDLKSAGAAAALFSSLGVGIVASVLFPIQSLTEVFIWIRRFPKWFVGTPTYQSMDTIFQRDMGDPLRDIRGRDIHALWVLSETASVRRRDAVRGSMLPADQGRRLFVHRLHHLQGGGAEGGRP